MVIIREYLDIGMEDVIMNAILIPKDGETTEDSMKRRKKWEEVKLDNKWSLQNHINNQSLTCALRIAELTLRDVYDKLKIECPYPNKYAKELIEQCEKLDEKSRKVILKMFYDLSVDWWKEDTVSMNSPKQKLREVVGRRMGRGSVPNRTSRLFRPYSMQNSPRDCNTVGVSVHWLYGLNDMPFFSKEPLVDKIVDAFCFVPEDNQEGLLAFVKKYAEDYRNA